MKSHNLKTMYYNLTGAIMRINGMLYKLLRAPSESCIDTIKVHLGPGQKNYLKGWINVDANILTAKIDVWADLKNPLPFNDNSIDIFYSHHVIEHLPNVQFHINEMYRCLKPNGKIRIGGPNGDNAIKKFIENDKDWFSDFPDSRTSIGGRFENFIFCRREHLTILTYSYLEELLNNAGFKDLKICLPSVQTNFKELISTQVLSTEYENDFDYSHTIIIESIK